MKTIIVAVVMVLTVVLFGCSQSNNNPDNLIDDQDALSGQAVAKKQPVSPCMGKKEGFVLRECQNGQKILCEKGKVKSVSCTTAPATTTNTQNQPAGSAASPSNQPNGPNSISISSCGTPAGGWQRDTTYTLSRDVIAQDNQACFEITALDRVTIDCAHHQILGLGSQDGIFLRGAVINDQLRQIIQPTIRNCVIANFGNGISVERAQNVVLESNTLTNNNQGLKLERVAGGSLTNNQLNLNRVRGIYITNSGSITLSSNQVSENQVGLVLLSSTNNLIENNRICANSVRDLQIDLGSAPNSGSGNIFSTIQNEAAMYGITGQWPLQTDYISNC
ncbi:right-handed parallel beta-helix repeat-containing protein [Candidatus Woesearchaeota archaeon]|nr:right-handed parallel beta-helix repeat-containing protein [Candidatus Woesearchaeota archaeon]